MFVFVLLHALDLARAAFGKVVESMCTTHSVRMFFSSPATLSPEVLDSISWSSETQDHLMEIIQAMPLTKPYFSVDSSLGEATPLLWKLREELAGALVVNVRGFHSDDVCFTDVSTKMSNRFGSIADLVQRVQRRCYSILARGLCLDQGPSCCQDYRRVFPTSSYRSGGCVLLEAWALPLQGDQKRYCREDRPLSL